LTTIDSTLPPCLLVTTPPCHQFRRLCLWARPIHVRPGGRGRLHAQEEPLLLLPSGQHAVPGLSCR